MAEKIMQGIKQISELIGQAVKKRVVCLYRVSTVGQVEKDDIPMQKQYCREFCRGQSGWEIVKEFSEKGVSGFKVSAKDRDAIQEIQKMALKGEFDILLVFMFDRLGRRDDETPFVVEWFVKQGIEVWSAMEGQQRFDTHVDKLLNYIRYQDLKEETLKVVRGTSRLNVDLLNNLIEETTVQMAELEGQIRTAEAELREVLSGAEQVRQEYAQLMDWAGLYDNCSFEAKKMIAAQFVKAVRVKRGYEVDIEFNVSFEEFQTLYLEPESEEDRRSRSATYLSLVEKSGQAG